MFRRLATAATATALLMTVAASAVAAGGPPGLAFYVDEVRYRTVATPTDLSNTGAPASSFDVIYAIDGQPNVAEAKPGDPDYNGGRWMVLKVTWTGEAHPLLTNAEAVEQAATDGLLTIDPTPVALFVCPVIPVQGGHH
jgi:hypothetical protein